MHSERWLILLTLLLLSACGTSPEPGDTPEGGPSPSAPTEDVSAQSGDDLIEGDAKTNPSELDTEDASQATGKDIDDEADAEADAEPQGRGQDTHAEVLDTSEPGPDDVFTEDAEEAGNTEDSASPADSADALPEATCPLNSPCDDGDPCTLEDTCALNAEGLVTCIGVALAVNPPHP